MKLHISDRSLFRGGGQSVTDFCVRKKSGVTNLCTHRKGILTHFRVVGVGAKFTLSFQVPSISVNS